MHQMIELHPRPDALLGLGLPAIPYPVALPAFKAAVANDGSLPLADMLRGLQLKAAEGRDHHERLEAAMVRLADLVAGDEARETMPVAGADWVVETGPPTGSPEALLLCRDGEPMAMLGDRGDGRLRVSGLRPLDAASIALLVELARDGSGGASAETPWARAQRAVAAGGHGGRLQPVAGGAGEPEVRRAACVAAEIRTWATPGG